jgi:hypothetical protein
MDGKCDPGWQCIRISDPIAREQCFRTHCIDYSLPWRRDTDYSKKTDSIPNWGDLADYQPWRIERARKVWNWVCETGGWWGSNCPTDQQLATWLLGEEQNILQNQEVYRFNSPEIETIIGYVVQYNHAELTAFDRVEALGRQTAFYNSVWDSKFNEQDWDSLMKRPVPAAFDQVNQHWKDDFSTFLPKKLVWWSPEENFGYSNPFKILSPNSTGKVEKVLQYYAIVDRP